jgi:hypothetical protein
MRNKILSKKTFRNTVFRLMLLLLGTGGFSSCNYLDVVPDQIPTFDDVFSDRNNTLKYLSSCYWALPRLASYNDYPGWTGSMEMILNEDLISESCMSFALGLNSAANPIYDYWSNKVAYRSLYAGIRECNVFLDNIDKVTDLPSAERERMKAEAKMLKAYMHFYLINQYGPVCPIRESPPVDALEAAKPYREKIDNCFQYVVDLLDEVIESNALPAYFSGITEYGRFNHPAACALKAKVLTYWASPLFNGNRDYVDFLDHKGEHFFNQEYVQSRWDAAAAACLEALQACVEGGIHLFGNSDYHAKRNLSDSTLRVEVLRSAISDQWNTNPEIILASYPGNVEFQRACIPRFKAGTASALGILSVPFSIVELFYSSNGVPVDEDKQWLESGYYENRYSVAEGDSLHRLYVALGQPTAQMNLNRETRFYSSLGFDRGKWFGNSYDIPASEEDIIYLKQYWGEPSSYITQDRNYNATGYFPKKLVGLGMEYQNENSLQTVDYQATDIRYADLLLMTAEALNEAAGGGDETVIASEVFQYIDAVRSRAGLKGVAQSWRESSIYPDKPFTKGGMREIIRRERSIELAFEAHDYWDTRRWKLARDEWNRPIQGWNIHGTDAESYYVPIRLYIQKFSHRDYFCPISEAEILNNPHLIQNPGW